MCSLYLIRCLSPHLHPPFFYFETRISYFWNNKKETFLAASSKMSNRFVFILCLFSLVSANRMLFLLEDALVPFPSLGGLDLDDIDYFPINKRFTTTKGRPGFFQQQYALGGKARPFLRTPVLRSSAEIYAPHRMFSVPVTNQLVIDNSGLPHDPRGRI